MTDRKRSLERIQEAFTRELSSFDLRLPEENLRERRKGSLPYARSGRLYYVFGEENGREYLEYYAYHRMGDDHGRIYDDGEFVGLPELCSMYGYNPNIPGDREREQAEMEREYRETLDDLVAKGLFEDEPIPGSLAVNSYLVLHDADDGEPDAPE